MRKKKDYMISVDWYQVYCIRDNKIPVPDTYLQGKNVNKKGYKNQYYIRYSKSYHPSYRISFDMLLRKQMICTISLIPRNSVVNKMGCAIKMYNGILYTEDWAWYLRDVAESLNWQIKNVTRCDICYDCNVFANGQRPEKFIAQYLKKSGSKKSANYIRSHSNKYVAYGTKKINSFEVDSIRWGSRESAYSVYLYNKSKELAEKKYKPWIVESWRKHDLDEKHVWRFEISITTSGTKLKKLDTGDILPLCEDFFKTQKAIEEAFAIYASKKANFKRNRGEKKVRDMEDVKIFEFSESPTLKPINPSKYLDTGRSEKICQNVLEKISENYVDLTTEDRVHLYKASNIVSGIRAAKRKKSDNCKYTTMLVEQFDAAKKYSECLDYLSRFPALNNSPWDFFYELEMNLMNPANWVHSCQSSFAFEKPRRILTKEQKRREKERREMLALTMPERFKKYDRL